MIDGPILNTVLLIAAMQLLWACSRESILTDKRLSINVSLAAEACKSVPKTGFETKVSRSLFALYDHSGVLVKSVKLSEGETEVTFSGLFDGAYTIAAVTGDLPSEEEYTTLDDICNCEADFSWNGYTEKSPGFTMFGKKSFVLDRTDPPATLKIAASHSCARIDVGTVKWDPAIWQNLGVKKSTLEDMFILNAPSLVKVDGSPSDDPADVFNVWEDGHMVFPSCDALVKATARLGIGIEVGAASGAALDYTLYCNPASDNISVSGEKPFLVLKMSVVCTDGARVWYYSIPLCEDELHIESDSRYRLSALTMEGPGYDRPGITGQRANLRYYLENEEKDDDEIIRY